jgi:phosphoribosylanthranilate isomerase
MVKQTPGGKEVHLRIKICGIMSVADGLLAVAFGADALGLNFFPRSKRYVAEATASAILRELPPFVDAVALFVNLPLRQACEAAGRLPGVRTIQWHGDEPEACPPQPYRFIPAFQVGDEDGLRRVTAYLDRCAAQGNLPAAVLVDGQAPGQYGGTGRPVPWQLLADFRPPVPLILAGGLTAETVAEAIRLVRPYAVDVAGGVESAPGVKDPEKLRRFIGNAREAAAKVGAFRSEPEA